MMLEAERSAVRGFYENGRQSASQSSETSKGFGFVLHLFEPVRVLRTQSSQNLRRLAKNPKPKTLTLAQAQQDAKKSKAKSFDSCTGSKNGQNATI